jgi:hypothetical protein
VAVAAGGKRVWAVLFTTSQEVEAPAPQEPAPAPAKKSSSKKAAHPKSVAAPTMPETTDEEQTTDETSAPPRDEEPVAPEHVHEAAPTGESFPVHSANEAAPVAVAPVACVPVPPAAPVPPPAAVRIERARVAQPVGQSSVAPAAQAAAQDATAAALFSDANAARRRGDHRAAIALYRDLTDKHDGAPEAAAARIALGRMLLDDGDAASALPLFDRYLGDGDGSLREEAMVGRAHAFEKLGRNYDELAAWNRLLASYPQSVHKAHAEARLEALKAR